MGVGSGPNGRSSLAHNGLVVFLQGNTPSPSGLASVRGSYLLHCFLVQMCEGAKQSHFHDGLHCTIVQKPGDLCL